MLLMLVLVLACSVPAGSALRVGAIVPAVMSVLMWYDANIAPELAKNRGFAMQALCLLLFRYPKCLNEAAARCFERGAS